MVLKGTVRNVIDFGVFVDIGVHQDGLVHISEITDKKFIKHPLEAVSVGDIVDVKVMSVDLKKKRIQLTMKVCKRGNEKQFEETCEHRFWSSCRKCNSGIYSSGIYCTHGVIMGGATGIGLTIAHYVPVDLSIIIFIVNSILFVLGAAVLGKKFCGSNNCKYIYLSNIFVYCAEDSGD